MADDTSSQLLTTLAGLVLPAAILVSWWATRRGKTAAQTADERGRVKAAGHRPVRQSSSGRVEETLDMVAEWYRDPPIYFYETGSPDWWAGGPPKLNGFYIHPFCDPGCCRAWGPFPTKQAALAWSRANLVTAETKFKYARIEPDPQG